MITLLMALNAHAETCETSFTTTELREVIGRAKAAIDEGDKAAHIRAADTLAARIPCIEGQIPTKEWADYLVTEALIKYLEKTPGWEKALKVALQLAPNHPDIQDFILEDYLEPPDPPGDPQPIPAGHVVFIDGAVVSMEVPPLDGLHVAQLLVDGKWTSKVLRGEGFPSSWLAVAPPPPKPDGGGGSGSKYPFWGSMDLYAGFSEWSQLSNGLDPTIVDRKTSGVTFGLASHGQYFFTGIGGVFWTASLSLEQSERFPAGNGNNLVPFGDVMAGIALLDKPLSIWLGGGMTTVRVRENEDERPFLVWHYLVGLAYRSGGAVPIDASAGGGWGPWALHARADAGASILSLGSVRLRVGARGEYVRANLGDATLPQFNNDPNAEKREKLVTAARWTGGVNVGVSWGRD